MVAADDEASGLEHLLAVVGHVDDDGILLLEAANDLVDDGVVVESGIVVPHQLLLPVRRHLRAVLLIVVGREVGLLLRVARVVVHVLPQEVEDDQGGRGVGSEAVPLLQQAVVPDVGLLVAVVEHCCRETRVVQEEFAGEIKHRLARLRQELVGEERHIVACPLEHFGEERIVAPRPLLSDDVGRQHVLEDETRQVPGRHYISELHQLACLLARHLSRRRRHVVAVELSMMFVVALADDKHNGWRRIGATVHRHPLSSLYQLVHLARSQLVGTYAERQSVDGLILLGPVVARHFVLDGPDGGQRHQAPQSLLVFPTCRGRPYKQAEEAYPQPLPEGKGDQPGCSQPKRHTTPLSLWRGVGGEAAQPARNPMPQRNEQQPPHPTGQRVPLQDGTQKLTRFAAVGLAHEHQHRGRQRRTVLLKAIDVGKSHGIEHEADEELDDRRPPPAFPFLIGGAGGGSPCPEEIQYHAEQVEVEEQFQVEVVVEFARRCVGHRQPSGHHTQHIQRHKRHCICLNGSENRAQSLSYYLKNSHYACKITIKIGNGKKCTLQNSAITLFSSPPQGGRHSSRPRTDRACARSGRCCCRGCGPT